MNKGYLNEEFLIYEAGLYNGKVRFTNQGIEVAPVDMQTRVQLCYSRYVERPGMGFMSYKDIHEKIKALKDCKWDSEDIRGDKGLHYVRHDENLWVQRDSESCIDILVSDNSIVGFIHPGRAQMTIIVKDGYQDIAPLEKYKDKILSQIRYGVRSLGNHMVPMRDGIRLATEVYIPEGLAPNERIPAILIRTCYGKEEEKWRFLTYVTRGYALIIQDVRGRDSSEGDFMPYYHEREDGSDTIDWVATQEWCDGNVGMIGASYLGYIVMSAAESGNPNLKAVISEVNVGSPFIDTIRPGGTVGSWLTLNWSLAQSVGQSIDFSVFGGRYGKPEDIIKMPIEEVDTLTIGKKSHHWQEFIKHYRYDDFWRHGDLTVNSHNIKAAILMQSGWHDGDKKGVAEVWRALCKHDVKNRRLVLGPWHHGLNSNRDMKDFKYGNNAIDYSFDIRCIKWMDRFLKNIDNGVEKEPRVTYYLDGENKWMHSNEWSPEDTTPISLYLSSCTGATSRLGDGRLSCELDHTEGFDTYRYDPKNPLGTEEMMAPVPVILNEAEMRSDTVVYSTKPLKENVAVAGNMEIEFYAASDAVDTDWYINLTDVDENGVSRKLSDNVIRAEYRNGFDKPELLTPNSIERYVITLPYQGHVFEVGHRIRVVITSSNKFMFYPNSNTGLDPRDVVETVIATQRIYHGKNFPSALKLPILFGEIE